MSKALLLISHGSRNEEARIEIERLLEQLQNETGLSICENAFLEVHSPTIPEGVEACVSKGATEITCLLNFLNAGNHVRKDIPNILEEIRQQYPKVCFKISTHLGAHPKLKDLFLEMINE